MRDVLSVSHCPAGPLREFVASAEGYSVPANPTGQHRGLPSRHLTLVVELAAPLQVTGLRSSVAAHGVVGGLHLRPALINAAHPQEGIQYSVTALGGWALLGVPASELHQQTIDLTDLWGSAANRLIDELLEATSWSERFHILDAALLRRLNADVVRAPDEVTEAWRMIFASDGQLRMAAVAAHVAWSRRHLSEQFRMSTGLTPKQAARIARFEAARRLLVSRGAVFSRNCYSQRVRRSTAPSKGMAGVCRLQRWRLAPPRAPIPSRQ
jgi:AraC-like DNA-binding protein